MSPHSRAPWAATAFVAVAAYCALWSLDATVLLGDWMQGTALVLVIAAAVMMTARGLLRTRIVPPLAGLVSAGLTMIPLYSVVDGERQWLPTLDGVTGLADAFSGGIEYAQTTTAPAVVEAPLAAVLTGVIVLIFVVAEALAVGARFVATAGLVLVLPWLAPIIIAQRVSLVPLMIALVCWVATMTLAKRGVAAQRPAGWPAAAGATAAFAVLLAIAAPASVGGPGWGLVPRQDLPEGLDAGATRLNLAIDLRNSLTTNSQTPVMYYLSSGAKPDALRLYTFVDFNGSSWARDDSDVTARAASGGVLWPEPVPDWAGASRTRLDIVMLSLIEKNLPLPNGPRTVEVEGPWFYNAATDEVVGDAVTTADLQYAVVADLDYHQPGALRQAAPAIGRGDGDPADGGYYAVAPAIDLTRVEGLTTSVIGDAATRYDAALAIQDFLRQRDEFTYDTSVAPSGVDSVSEFLDSRSGYCVQFASTMVTMLRSQGIPARMAVGFLPGTRDGDGYVVEGGDAHAWPEVYFPDHGWVRFEPTPSVQTGSPPPWADPFLGQVPVPREVLEGGQFPTTPNDVRLPDPSVDAVDPGVTLDQQSGTVPWWVWSTVAVVVGLGALAALWWWRRSSPVRADRHAGVEGAWRRLARDLGDLTWPQAATPVEAGRHVLRTLERITGAPPSESSLQAVRALIGAIVARRYLPTHTEPTQAEADAWVDQILEEIKAATATPSDR